MPPSPRRPGATAGRDPVRDRPDDDGEPVLASPGRGIGSPARPGGTDGETAPGSGRRAAEVTRPAAVGAPASLDAIADRVGDHLDALLRREEERWTSVDEALAAPIEALRLLVGGGGKRLRPAFCHWAYVGAGGDPGDERLVATAAAVELLHTFALVHDDVMDGADVRRSQPSVHRRFIRMHVDGDWRGEARRFGEGAAILVGDFAFVYADTLMGAAGPEAWRVFDELRLELCVGQYLDLATTASRSFDVDRARRIERFKSGKYTVERPLHLGAALAGRGEELAAPLSRIGLPLGEAFQLRDDVLGTFGDPEQLGKPVGADLRDGKLTPLVAVAWQRSDPAQRAVLERIGSPDLDPDGIDAARRVVLDTGALAHAEARIAELLDEALAAVEAAPLTGEAARELADLARFVAWRDR